MIFGAEGREAGGRLVCRSLHFELPRTRREDPEAIVFRRVASTAREAYSRRPKDKTLRTTEYAAAGLEAEGEIRLQGDERELALVKLCLQRVSTMGGGKTRGAGRIRIERFREEKAFTSPPPSRPEGPPDAPCRLRMVLHNLEPLCIAATGFPGNIIRSESFLPGQGLRGAWLRGIRTCFPDAELADELADPERAQFTNAYFVPPEVVEAFSDDLGSLQSIPLPLTARERKPTEQEPTASTIPWWVEERNRIAVWLADPKIEQDILLSQPSSGEEGSFKRVKGEEYLVALNRLATEFRRVRPAMTTLLRNRIPVGRQERTRDSRRLKGVYEPEDLKKAELFSEEVLAEDQRFVADLLFLNGETARRFARHAEVFLGGDVEDRAWLRVGRGGRPVVVEDWTWVPEPRAGKEGPAVRGSGFCPGGFSFTLTSDLIARDDDLTFLTEITGADLVRLSGADVAAEAVRVSGQSSVQETRAIHAFNTAAGVRRMGALAIKRGSAVRVECEDEAMLQALRDRLTQLETLGRGLGERVEEGFGRFAVDHGAHVQPVDEHPGVGGKDVGDGNAEEDGDAVRRQRREAVLESVLRAVEQTRLEAACATAETLPKDFPAVSQWQRLRHVVEIAQGPDHLDGILQEIVERSSKLSGRMWACRLQGDTGPRLCEEIDRLRKEAGEFEAQRIWLIYLSRWVVARLRRLGEDEENRTRDRGKRR